MSERLDFQQDNLFELCSTKLLTYNQYLNIQLGASMQVLYKTKLSPPPPLITKPHLSGLLHCLQAVSEEVDLEVFVLHSHEAPPSLSLRPPLSHRPSPKSENMFFYVIKATACSCPRRRFELTSSGVRIRS
jgi:hypothetical protein